jgi:hypothetical protein
MQTILWNPSGFKPLLCKTQITLIIFNVKNSIYATSVQDGRFEICKFVTSKILEKDMVFQYLPAHFLNIDFLCDREIVCKIFYKSEERTLLFFFITIIIIIIIHIAYCSPNHLNSDEKYEN